MHSVSELCALHGCGSDWMLRRWDWDGSQVQTHSGPGPGPQEEGRWGQSTAGAAVGGRARARPGKSLSLSETPGLGHDTGMRVSLKRWRGPKVITQLLVSGGSQAGKQSWATQTWLCPPRDWASLGESHSISGLSFSFGRLDAQHTSPDSVSWASVLTQGSGPVPSVRQK